MTVRVERSSTTTNLYQPVVKGALVGAAVVAAVAAYSLQQSSMEAGWRAIGFAPKWPIFEGDCELDQFRGSSMCTAEPLITLRTPMDVVVAAGVTILTGALCGAGVVAKRLFS